MLFSPSFFRASSSSLPVVSLNCSTKTYAMPGFSQMAFFTLLREISSRITRESDGLLAAFAGNHDGDLRAARTFQQVGHFGGGEVVGGLIVHLHDDVARPQARAIGGRTGERRDHDGLAVERPHLHADAEVVALLVFAQELVIAGIEEIGVRVERAQHARDGALVDGFIGIHLVGEVLFDQAIDAGEGFQAGADFVAAVADGGRRLDLGSEDAANEGAQENEAKKQEETSAAFGASGKPSLV